MDSLIELIRKIMDVQAIIQWGGLLMICIIVFVETGLFVGFFLPGDSLLVTAGIFETKRPWLSGCTHSLPSGIKLPIPINGPPSPLKKYSPSAKAPLPLIPSLKSPPEFHYKVAGCGT